jgi:hypothetical protein
MIRKHFISVLAIAVGISMSTDLAAASISVGNLVVVQVGGSQGGGAGGAALSSSSQPTFLKEFSTAGGAPVQTISLPTTVAGSGNRALTNNGTSTSEGFIAQSANGEVLTLMGYNSAPGGTNSGVNANVVNRVVGVVDIATGGVDTTTALSNSFNASNARSATALNATYLYPAGNGGSGQGASAGVRTTTTGSTTSTQLNTNNTNVRVAEVAYGQLYASTASGTNLGIGTIGSGFPLAATNFALLPGMPTSGSHSIYDFWFSNPTTIYAADEGSAANGGGIQKWALNSSNSMWELQYILLSDALPGQFNGTSTTAVRGLTGYTDGTTVTLYATTTQGSANNLIKIVDVGSGGGTATILATAPTNTVFRGVEFINVPEPASSTLYLLAASIAGCGRRRT